MLSPKIIRTTRPSTIVVDKLTGTKRPLAEDEFKYLDPLIGDWRAASLEDPPPDDVMLDDPHQVLDDIGTSISNTVSSDDPYREEFSVDVSYHAPPPKSISIKVPDAVSQVQNEVVIATESHPGMVLGGIETLDSVWA